MDKTLQILKPKDSKEVNQLLEKTSISEILFLFLKYEKIEILCQAINKINKEPEEKIGIDLLKQVVVRIFNLSLNVQEYKQCLSFFLAKFLYWYYPMIDFRQINLYANYSNSNEITSVSKNITSYTVCSRIDSEYPTCEIIIQF